MNKHRALSLSLVLITAATTAGVAKAQDASATQDGSMTREQVLAELHAAQAAGLVPHGDLDISAHNGGPDNSPARTAISTATRAQVKADLLQSIKTGSILVGDNSRTLAEIDPPHYPQPAPVAGLTRAEVRAQLAKAIRLGDMAFGDEGRTMAETDPARYAVAPAEEMREQAAARAPDATPTQVASTVPPQVATR